jgi:hypothetical protein
MKYSSYEVLQLPNSNVLHNDYSNTIRNEKEKNIWEQQYQIVKEHYFNKWGGYPDNETYKTPWNL